MNSTPGLLLQTPAQPVFFNIPQPFSTSPIPQPRIVYNIMSSRYRVYNKSATSDWGDFPTATLAVTWGGDVDPSQQWLEVTNSGGVTRAWATFSIRMVVGYRYLISFTVDSIAGTMANGNFTSSLTGGITLSSTGRYAVAQTPVANGNISIRLGIGTDNVNTNPNCTIRFSNVMVEIAPLPRTYPYEYVNPFDQRAFPYTYTATMTGTKVNVVTTGTPYTISPYTTSLVVGDSFTNDQSGTPPDFGAVPTYGDFPYQARRWLASQFGINSRGVPGASIDQITQQIIDALAETTITAGVSPYLTCIAEGGIINISAGQSLAQIQTAKLNQIAVITGNGMVPVLFGLTPWDAANASQAQMILDVNAWMSTLGYPMYNPYYDADNGLGKLKSAWGSPDGLHPGTSATNGSAMMGTRLTQLLELL